MSCWVRSEKRCSTSFWAVKVTLSLDWTWPISGVRFRFFVRDTAYYELANICSLQNYSLLSTYSKKVL